MRKKKKRKMRQGRAAVKETDWRMGGNRRGKKEEETKGRACACGCECARLQKPPTVMRQTNELAFCHAGHMCVWMTGTGAS